MTLITILRFWEKVEIKNKNFCWNWTGGNNGFGYGRFRFKNKKYGAHRFSYELHNGPIPKKNGHHGTCVLHKCDNRKCVNPDHLFLGTHSDNMKDKVKKGRCNSSKGENRFNHKLKNNNIKLIKNLYKSGNFSQRQLAKKFNVSQTAIRYLLINKTWKHI